MKYLKWPLILFVALFLNGCTNDSPPANNQLDVINDLNTTLTEKDALIQTLNEDLSEQSSKIAALENELEELKSDLNTTVSSATLLSTSLDVLDALSNEDMMALSTHVHPTLGIRFTPYGYIDLSNDLVFSSSAIPTLLADSTIHTWGSFDGSGEPINLTTTNYFDDFVYDEDYLNPHMIGMNNIIGTGNSLINITTAYPNASFVEFHFTGFDPQYGGIDWSSLILSFENVAGEWKLTGIIHNQWTI